MSPSARDVMEMNIRHYRKLLEAEIEPDTRQTVEKLLLREEEALADCDRRSRERPQDE